MYSGASSSKGNCSAILEGSVSQLAMPVKGLDSIYFAGLVGGRASQEGRGVERLCVDIAPTRDGISTKTRLESQRLGIVRRPDPHRNLPIIRPHMRGCARALLGEGSIHLLSE
jgi:hypothetical protein